MNPTEQTALIVKIANEAILPLLKNTPKHHVEGTLEVDEASFAGITVTGLKIQYMFDIEDGVEPRKIK